MPPSANDNKRKSTTKISKPSGKMVQYPNKFSVKHCKNAFEKDCECVYALCPVCYLKEGDGAKGANNKRNRVGNRKVNKDDNELCSHELNDLLDETDKRWLKITRNDGKPCHIPKYCTICTDQL